MVSGALVSMLLKGGYGDENVRLSPFYRSTVGFDRLFNLLDQTARWSRPRLAALQRREDR